ncbi:hypothetical protein AMCSP06_002339 [Streptococcus pneumoniae 2070768]|nr:hypothetical protein AMCSP06_002339 [Streptococcus pneumoniae 2070768]
MKSSADTTILSTCLEKNVGDYPRNITTSVRQLGANAQRLEW